ncbi:hypothetical protein WPS_07230 [Vulcanimicrobium alpinum]|uniref:Uncharacterized protein n=1 Tax=Vulcanimicrobium alpinum TaxID=3016050 RepID=A0AAN1XTP0_UNVUL|nr:hypothetical protein WPS_07230 [Vulcanimicrobium alpinum]
MAGVMPGGRDPAPGAVEGAASATSVEWESDKTKRAKKKEIFIVDLHSRIKFP